MNDKLTNAACMLSFGDREPFWAHLALRLERVPTTHYKGRPLLTTATDGERIYYNPAFIAGLDQKTAVTVLVLSVWHCALGYLWRREGRNLGKWAQACHQSAATGLLEANKGQSSPPFPMPKEWLPDPKFAGMAPERVYDLLPDQDKKGQELSDVPAYPLDAQPQTTEQEWQGAVAAAGQGAGNLPGELKTRVNSDVPARVRWQDHLRRFVGEYAKDDYSWQRPNRRLMSLGHYMPGLHSEHIGRIVAVRDSSGSTAGYWGEFTAELQNLLDTIRPASMTLIDADTETAWQEDYMPGDALSEEIHGGGGTSFVQPLAELADNPPVCCVYLTDLYGEFPEEPPDFPVLWVATTDLPVPFGEVARIYPA